MELDPRTTEELIKRERRYWQALKERNRDKATVLSADPSIVVGAQGVSEISRERLGAMIESAGYELEQFRIEDVQARRVSDDVAVLAYKVTEKLTVEGEKVELEAFESSVWVERDGEWVCAVHTESIAGDPFGRDH